MSRPVIAPFLRPPVKPDSAAQPRTLQGGRPLLPTCGNRGFLPRRDVSRGPSARRVIPVRVIDLNPMPSVVGAVSPVEFSPMFVDDKIHSLRSLVIALRRLLPFTLAEADVVLVLHATVFVEAHLVSLLIHQNQCALQLRDKQLAMRADECRRLGVTLAHPLLVFAIGRRPVGRRERLVPP